MNSNWLAPFSSHQSSLPFKKLSELFDFAQFTTWPNAAGLNRLKRQSKADVNHSPDFICQSQLGNNEDYYEQYIFNHHRIPTRPDNWHDFFNGLIWLQFPQTKRLLNQLHMEDITQFGLHPRSHRRNKLTHFDECGVVLAIECGQHENAIQGRMPELLRQHEWRQVFVDNRRQWGATIHSFMFGHANLEMLLQPFIGLTGKWLSVEVPSGFGDLSGFEQLALTDQLLCKKITDENVFAQKNGLFPLPLLGIPDVTEASEDPRYYDNNDYFRPRSKYHGK